MFTKSELEKLGLDVVELVTEARSTRTKRKASYPTIDIWRPAHTKGRGEDGVFLTQDGDEIWLTAGQARKLIEDLKKYYPDEKTQS